MSSGALSGSLLIVEDEPLVARNLARLFARRTADVAVASSCAAARLVARGQDIGVFDLELGDGFGADLALELLAHGGVRRAVFFTACIDPERLARAAAVGRVFAKGDGVSTLMTHVFELVAALYPSASGPENPTESGVFVAGEPSAEEVGPAHEGTGGTSRSG